MSDQQITCPRCNGEGVHKDPLPITRVATFIPCDLCSQTGTITIPDGYRICSTCGGRSAVCDECQGTGITSDDEDGEST